MAFERTLADLRGYWSKKDVEALAARHVVHGVSATQFDPDRLIIRAELTALLLNMLAADPARALLVEGSATPAFRDVPPGAWSFAVVETAARHGLVKGSDGLFRPDDPVTREEMAAMLLRAMGQEEKAPGTARAQLPFKNVDRISAWVVGVVAGAWQKGLLRGVSAEELRPRAGATRAEAAVTVLRAMEQLSLVTAPVTASGTITVSEIEGRHFELTGCSDSAVERYVLLPVSEHLRRLLEAAAGKETTAVLSKRALIFSCGDPSSGSSWWGRKPRRAAAEKRKNKPGGLIGR